MPQNGCAHLKNDFVFEKSLLAKIYEQLLLTLEPLSAKLKKGVAAKFKVLILLVF